jgi:hypothetical protein
MPLNPAFWDKAVANMDAGCQIDPVVQSAQVAQSERAKHIEPPTISELANKAKRIGLCGAINSERVCVRPTEHAGRHEARYLGGPKDGQVIHWWPNVFKPSLPGPGADSKLTSGASSDE